MKNIFVSVFIILGIVMSNNSNANSNAYKFKFRSIDGKEIKLIDFKGKPIFIINTASLCGFTNQYNDIQEIYNKYKKNDLIVLAIPSNDFGNQELSTNEEVKEFCSINFDISFLLTEITTIKGEKGHDFFKWIKKEAGFLAFPKWNFYKYLIDKNGQLVSWYASTTNPNSKKINEKIKEIMAYK
jgi:glutathione peroxidase